MMNYCIQVILFQALFLCVYDLFLSKETFFSKNRAYLITSLIGSFLIPLIKVNTIREIAVTEYAIVLPEIVLSPETAIDKTSLGQMMSYESVSVWNLLFYAGLLFTALIFVIKLWKIIRLIRNSAVQHHTGYKIVTLKNSKSAFSFFNYVFLGDQISVDKRIEIKEHELVHVKQKHTWDLLFFEVIKIIMWFNPLIYTYQNRMALIHEYLSDASRVKKGTKSTYMNHLLTSLFDVENISFVNQFYKQKLMKKRIMMIAKGQSRKMNQWKYLLILPLLVGMTIYSSCSQYEPIVDDALAKEFKTVYNSKNGQLTSVKLNVKSVFDSYFGPVYPFKNQIGIDKLTIAELQEYESIIGREVVRNPEIEKFSIELFELENGRKLIAYFLKEEEDISQVDVSSIRTIKDQESTDMVAFVDIDQIPTYPGCAENDRDCFNRSVQVHFAQNFDSNLPKKANLPAGKKRVIMQFGIGLDGNVQDISVKAPHDELIQEATRIIQMLPKMTPGKQKGKDVVVKYTLPMRIDVN